MRLATCRTACSWLHLCKPHRVGVKFGWEPADCKRIEDVAPPMVITRTRRALLRIAIAGAAGLACFASPAAAMPPAHGLTDAEAVDAGVVLEAATERGVGDLPASPFLKSTPCGIADAALVRAARAHRTALVSLRRGQAARRDVRSAQRRVVVARVRLAAAKVRRAKLCGPETAQSTTDPDDGTLRGTTVAERPRSIVAGTGMVIALPIEFSDVRANRASHTPSRYRDLLFGDDYRFGGGSLASFYEAMSYGSFTVDGDVEAWRRMPRRRAAYAADNGGMGAYPGNSQLLLEDAVRANDATVDFARYDNDGPDKRPNSGDDDGFVDAVFLVYAGSSAAESGNLDALWPHAWRHTVATGDASASGGFVKVGRYAAVPERMEETGPDGDLLTVGVVAHEFGHILGLPDLVDGDDDDHRGPGAWDLMGSGLWGFSSSSRPSGLSAWSRARLGWVTPQLLEGDHVGYRLGASYAQRSIVKLPIAGTPLHEHYLVERRTRTGFDSDAPADGLLVWHIDDSVASGGTSKHPRVELVAADGIANGDAGDLLRASDQLSDSTTPSTKAHAGSDSLVAIQNVQDATVDLHAGRASLAATIDAAIDDAGPSAAAPTAVLTAPVAGARLRGTVPMSCDGTGTPNINRISFQRSGTALTNVNVAPSAAATTQTYSWATGTLNGNYTMTCSARNTSNQTTISAGVAVTLDNALPAVPTMSAPAIAPTWLRGTVLWTSNGTDNYGVTRFSYRVDGVDNWQGPWAELTPKANTYSWDTTTATNGAHVLTVRSEDLAGNQSNVSANRNVNVDNLAPTMTLPADGTVLPDIDQQTSTTTLNARWTAGTDAHSGMASYSWRFCTSPACATVVASGSGAGLTATAGSLSLAVGTYYACVRAIDVAGNQSADTCSDGVIVDNVAPTMSAPMDASVAPDLDYQASTTTLNAVWSAASDGAGTGVAGYDWRFCTSPACGTILASGSGAGLTATAGSLTLTNNTTYFACVRARDQLVNTSGYTCSDGITVDTVVPVMGTPLDGTIAPDVDFQTSTATLNATWSAATDTGSGVAAYDWRFCTSPACGTILASGSGAALTSTAGSLTLASGTTYFACVRARDNVSLQSAYSCSDGVLVDSGPPVMPTPNDGSPAPDIDFQGSTTTLSANWAAATDAGSAVAGYDWRLCTTTACGTILGSGSGTALTAAVGSLTLANGATYFACVRATDSAGNQSAYVCSDGIAVDTAAPVVTTPRDGTAADISSQLSTIALDGNWTAASDGAGSGTASYDWRFCTTVACGTIVASGSGAATTASATGLTLTAGTTYYTCVRAIDQLGNTSAYTCSNGVLVDAAPDVTITSPATGGAATGTVAVNATATDPGGGIVSFEYRLDGGAPVTFGPFAPLSPRSATWSWNSNLASEGSHSIQVMAYDSSGLTDTDTITLTVDRTAPSGVSHGGITPNSIVAGTSMTFTSTATDPGGIDRVDYWIDGSSVVSASAAGASPFSDPGTAFNAAGLPDGNHGFIAVAYDLAGNMALTGTPETFFVLNKVPEGTNPTGSVTSPSAGALAASNVTLVANVSDNNVVVKVEWLLDGSLIPGVAADIVQPGFSGGIRTKIWSNTNGVAPGAHTISARITDASGNQFTTAAVNVTK